MKTVTGRYGHLGLLLFGACLILGGVGAEAQEATLAERLASKQTIGLVLEADEEDQAAESAFRALMLVLEMEGYSPKDLRQYAASTDSVIAVAHRSGIDVEAIGRLRVSVDSVNFDYEAKHAGRYWRTKVPKLSLTLKVDAVSGMEELFDERAITEGKVMRKVGMSEDTYLPEPMHSIIQRGIIDLLRDVPVCTIVRQATVRYRVPVVAYADPAFRTLHKELWQKEIETRMSIAAAFFRSQFQIDLQLAGVRPWEIRSSSGVEVAAWSLQGKSNSGDTLVLGFMFDPKSVILFTESSNAGMASFLNTYGAVRELPQFVDEGYWYTLNHALVIVHEIAHMLGGVHVDDQGSFLYPAMGLFGSRFDPLNVKIVNITRRTFSRLSYPERIRSYLPLIFQLQVWSGFRRSLNIASLNETLRAQWFDSAGVRVRAVVLDSVGMDSAVVHALAGLRDFSHSRWGDARRHFVAALDADPGYIEATSYLERIAEAEHDEESAARYRRSGWELRRRSQVAGDGAH